MAKPSAVEAAAYPVGDIADYRRASPANSVQVWGKEIFVGFLGPEWAAAGDISRYVAIISFINFVHSPISTSLIVMGRERLMPMSGVAVLIYRPLCLYLGHRFGSLTVGLALLAVFELVQALAFQIVAFRRTVSVHTA